MGKQARVRVKPNGQLEFIEYTGVGGGLGIPDLVLSNGATTASHNVWMPIPFADLAYPLKTVEGDAFDWTITDDGDTGNDRWEVRSLKRGWYAYELLTSWDQVTSFGSDGAATQRVNWATPAPFVFPESDLRESADWLDPAVHSFFEMVDNNTLHGFHTVHLGGNALSGSATRTWKPTAKQTTNTNRGLSGLVMKFWFLGEDDITDWTFDFV